MKLILHLFPFAPNVFLFFLLNSFAPWKCRSDTSVTKPQGTQLERAVPPTIQAKPCCYCACVINFFFLKGHIRKSKMQSRQTFNFSFFFFFFTKENKNQHNHWGFKCLLSKKIGLWWANPWWGQTRKVQTTVLDTTLNKRKQKSRIKNLFASKVWL